MTLLKSYLVSSVTFALLDAIVSFKLFGHVIELLLWWLSNTRICHAGCVSIAITSTLIVDIRYEEDTLDYY